MSDDRIESELRAWLAAHTESDIPENLRRFLTELPSAQPDLDRVQRPRVGPVPETHRRGVLPAFVACLIVVVIGTGLYGLSQRPEPTASRSPSASIPQPSPVGSTPPSSPTGTIVVAAAPVDADHGWALTHDDLVWTDDGGATWTSIRPTDVVVATIHAVHFLGTSGWIVWSSPTTGVVTVERTSDRGRTWSASHIPDVYPDGVGVTSIEAVDGGTVWIQVQAVGSSASSFGGLYLSRDGGISWVPGITIPGGWPVRFVSPSDGWTFARPLRDELDATRDGGRTWHQVKIDRPPGHEQDAMSFDLPTFTSDVGIPQTGVLPVTLYGPPDPSGGEGTATLALYTTDDGGTTWRFATAVGTTAALGQGVTIASAIVDQQTWLVASSPERAALSKTSDGGRTWTDIGATGLNGIVDTLQFVDATDGWALTQPKGTDYRLSATRDGGRTWRLLDPVAQPTVPPSPTASAAAGPYRWTLVSSEGELATYSVVQVIRRRDGTYLSVASDGQQARILSSQDGRTWTVEPGDPGLLESSADHVSLVSAVVEGAHGFIAVGATALNDISSGDARAWTSSDGVQWHAAGSSSGMADAEMEAVTTGPDGYVAVGSDGFPGGNTQLPGARGAAAWISADGTRWTRVAGQGSFAGAIMTGVRRIDPGYVAWGETFAGRNVAGVLLPPIWTSSDGIRWDRATGITDAGGPGAPITAIISIGKRLVAVGARRLPDAEGAGHVPGAWTSTDGGRTWSPAVVADDAAGARRSGTMFDVATDGPDLIAVGRLEPPDGPGSAAVWRSSDQGSTWTRLPDDPSFARAGMRHVVSRGTGFVVFGQADDPNAYADAALIWVAEPIP